MFKKKCLLLVGGNGHLGKEVVTKFKVRPKWKVFSIDTSVNENACANFVIDPSQEIGPKIVEDLHNELEEFCKGKDEFEAIINVAGSHYPPNTQTYLRKLKRERGLEEIPKHPFSVSSPECFSTYARIQQTEILSSMLSVHLASKFLSPTGLLVLSGSESVVHGGKKATPFEHIAKSVVMQQALNLSVDQMEEGLVWHNTNIISLALDKLIEDRTKALEPAINHDKEWLNVAHVAHMLKFWAGGENRPTNGSVVSLETHGSRFGGRYVMPKFWN